MPTAKKGKTSSSKSVRRKARRAMRTGADETKAAAQARLSVKAKNGRPEKILIPKEELAAEIATIIRYHHLTQTEAARIVGDAASQISLLMSGRLEGFSTERLLRMLLRLGRDIELVFRPAPNPRAAKFRITHKSDLGAPAV